MQSLEVICASRAHCPTCRNKDGGRAWRESLAQAFIVPGDAPDFTCPYGLEWGANPESIDTSPQPIQPVPRDQWPLAVRVVARLKRDGEPGIGTTLARLIAGVGGEQYKRLMKRIGIDCGCAARQAMLDATYPY
jgi:hypothetical protein